MENPPKYLVVQFNLAAAAVAAAVVLHVDQSASSIPTKQPPLSPFFFQNN